MSPQLPAGIAPEVAAFIAGPHHMLIGAQHVAAASGQTLPVYDPSSDSVIAHVPAAAAEDVGAAVAAARAAFDSGPWRTMSAADRGKLIWRLADLLEARREEFAQIEALDNGKPLAAARNDVTSAVNMFRYMAGWTTKIEGNTLPISVPDTFAYTRPEPVGVVGAIIPWNYPLSMAAWKLAPALAAGCTVVLKPAEQTPLSALRLGALFLEAGFPEGVVNIVTGYGEAAGAALTAHPDVDKVAFTGSTEVGRLILNAAAGNLKKVSLELGGKSPNIIFADADLDVAIPAAASAIFTNMGQNCSAGSRLYVERSVYAAVAEGVAAHSRKLRVGPAFDAQSQLGPLVSREQLERVSGYVEVGVAEGAQALAGGQQVGERGYFYAPTVLVDTRPEMRVVREEIFGPVVTVLPFDDAADAIRQANDTVYGLAAGVWTRDVSKAHRVAHALRAGRVWVNCYNIFDPALPFGGYKQSGWGREMGHAALELYTEIKSVCVKL